MSAPSHRPTRRKPMPTSASALVHFHMGRPVTDSLAIAQEFASRHDTVLQKLDGLIVDGTIGRLDSRSPLT